MGVLNYTNIRMWCTLCQQPKHASYSAPWLLRRESSTSVEPLLWEANFTELCQQAIKQGDSQSQRENYILESKPTLCLRLLMHVW